MNSNSTSHALILGFAFVLGTSIAGCLISDAALEIKSRERTVTVKGLSEREYPADIVIWPIQFIIADHQLEGLYQSSEQYTDDIINFLQEAGIKKNEITVSAPAITDKLAQSYGNTEQAKFRYTASQTVTVYSRDISRVRPLMNRLRELGKRGIAFTAGDYQNQVEYLFSRLNEIKPEMIQEATTHARQVARKFAEDSDSRLGKIKSASQGSFSIDSRDKNNPHIKKIRVVSTVVYYLSD